MYSFKEACATYKLLRSKAYPERATLKLVGDRHRLSKVQRNCMFRGVIPDDDAENRRRKLVQPGDLRGQAVAVDWYNVLITIESYLRGGTLFLADDGVVRDASATHGSYRTSAVTDRAIGELVEEVGRLALSRIDVYLDLPIAFSGRMAEDLRERLGRLPIPSRVSLAQSADFALKASPEIVASSDSVVLDRCSRAVDLARVVLEERFRFSPPLVHDLFPESPGSLPQ
jgi:hypothetical protein